MRIKLLNLLFTTLISLTSFQGEAFLEKGKKIAADGVDYYCDALAREGNYPSRSKFQSSSEDLNQLITNPRWVAVGALANCSAMAIDNNGNIYAGSPGGIFKWNGTTWLSIGANLKYKSGSARVWDISISSTGDVYVGGAFDEIGGQSINGIAKWNGTTWSAMGSGFESDVSSIKISKMDEIYVLAPSGNKTAFKWDPNTSIWNSLGNTNGPSSAMAIAPDGTLYLGGLFSKINNTAVVNGVAKWDGTSWSALGTGINGVSQKRSDQIYSIVVADNGIDVYFGGKFSTMNNNIKSIAKWNGSSWSALPGLKSGENNIGIASNGDVYVRGALENGSNTTSSLLKWTGTSWIPVGDLLFGGWGDMSFYNNTIYMGRRSVGTFASSVGKLALQPPVVVNNNTTQKAISIAGSQYMEATSPNNVLPQKNLPRTVEAWVKTSQGGIGNIVSWGTRATKQRCSFAVRNNNIAFIGEYSDYTGNKRINDGNWHHIAFTYDGFTLRFYVDGQPAGEKALGINTIGHILRIGVNATPVNNEYFNGSISEVRIWNKALSEQAIKAAMNHTFSNPTAVKNCLVAYYTFGGNSATTVQDLSSNGLDGTIKNGGTIVDATGVQLTSTAIHNCPAEFVHPDSPFIDFSGAGQYIGVSGTNLPIGANSRTVYARIKTNQGSIGNIVSWGTRGAKQRCGFAVRNGKIAFIGQNTDYMGTASINDNQWHHIVFTYDGTKIRFYVDGLPAGEQNLPINTVGQNLRIGTISSPSLTEFFGGRIKDVKIWNQKLEASEITTTGTSTSKPTIFEYNAAQPIPNNFSLNNMVKEVNWK